MCLLSKSAVLIAIAGKARIICEALIAAFIRKIMANGLKKDPEPLLRVYSFSNSTMLSRIDEIDSDNEEYFCNLLQNMDLSLQLHKSNCLTMNLRSHLCVIYL